MACKTSCRAYSNYQPPYEECTCGGMDAPVTAPLRERLEQVTVKLQHHERARFRQTLRRWLRDGYTQNGTPLDDYGKEVLRDVMAALDAEGREED